MIDIYAKTVMDEWIDDPVSLRERAGKVDGNVPFSGRIDSFASGGSDSRLRFPCFSDVVQRTWLAILICDRFVTTDAIRLFDLRISLAVEF